MAAQLTATKGPAARGDEACRMWAICSLPTPVSPRRSTGRSPCSSGRICA